MRLLLPLIFLLALTGCANLKWQKPEQQSGRQFIEQETYLGQTIYVATIDPNLYDINLQKADTLDTTANLAKQANAFLAINAGFFNKDGASSNTLKIGDWLQKPIKNRGVVGWSNNNFYFDRLENHEYIQSSIQQDSTWWTDADTIVNGTPLLIYQNEILDPAPENTLQTFIDKRYARTAICENNHQQILLVVVEGSDSLGHSIGIKTGLNIKELAQYLKNKGCVNALNLDGGRSSTMVADGIMINHQPILNMQRQVANAITVTKSSYSSTQELETQAME